MSEYTTLRRVTTLLRRILLCLVFIFILVGCSEALSETERELLRELEKESRSTWKEVTDAFTREAKAQFKQTREQVEREISKKVDTYRQDAQYWLGFEAPDDVGVVRSGLETDTEHAVIKTAFIEAYKQAGGARTIGTPSGLVELEGNALTQEFNGGSHQKSIIVMEDGYGDKAYVVPGDWLQQYMVLGGPSKAGFPADNPEGWGRKWLLLPSGQRQLYTLSNGTEYALMKANGTATVHIVPPVFWRAYREAGGAAKLGYPLSSYPLNDTSSPQATSDTRALLDVWHEQPYRMQLFENGSIIYRADWSEFEIVEAQGIQGGGVVLDGSVGDAFREKYKNFSSIEDQCFIDTIRHAGGAIKGRYGEILFNKVPLIPIKAALGGATIGVDSLMTQIALESAELTCPQKLYQSQ